MTKKKKQGHEFGCCPNTHAKFYEISLIIGFSLSLSLLIVNMILTLWCFKTSYCLLSLEIIPIALNAINIVLSIILRCWRSNGSVFKNNFSASIYVFYFILILIIINLLSSIVEEFFYFWVYVIYKSSEGKIIANLNFAGDILDKIINKNDGDEGKGPSDSDLKIVKILPWIAFNFNIFIQVLTLIFILIIRGRINLNSDYGFIKKDKSRSSMSKVSINPKNKRRKSAGLITSKNSEIKEFKKVKKKKKKRYSMK